MKRVFYGSLLSRAFLLIVVLITASLAASLMLFRHAEQEPRTRQMAQLVVSVVNLTRAAVLSAAPEWQGALLSELAEAEGLRLHISELDELLDPLPDQSAELQLMMDKVRHSLGENTRFAGRRNGVEALWVSFYIGHEEFWVALPHERIEHPVSHVLLVWGVVVLCLALLGAYFIARQVALPLRNLALAAKKVGLGEMPHPLPEQGVSEVVDVSRAFNQMSADLAANERERAIVLAGISHDLRTPLARVRLAAELAADEDLRAGLISDVVQMDAVIGQFLDYARLDESEALLLTDFGVLVAEVAARFRAMAVSLELQLQPVAAVAVRPLLLRRALANLLDNAIKYGGGEITVQLECRDGKVVLSVMDKGAGIPAGMRESVKRPFIRLADARTDVTGSGLGLAIVARAARLHQGEFQLDECAGGGLAARLILPL
ncbi:MAG: ATP-binding protein [Nitrosomonadales bacterium]